MDTPNWFLGCPLTLAKRAEARVSAPAMLEEGTPSTARLGLLVDGVYTAVLFFPKSTSMTANSPLSSRGWSTAVLSAAIRAALARPGSPSQSASPVMQGPVFTPKYAVSVEASYANRTSYRLNPVGSLTEGE